MGRCVNAVNRLDDALQRVLDKFSGVVGIGDQLSDIVGVSGGSGVSTRAGSRAGSSSTAGAGRAAREPGAESPIRRYQAYVRALQAQGFRGRDIPSYQEWLAGGGPSSPQGGFGYGGSVNPSLDFANRTGQSPYPGSPHFGRSTSSGPVQTSDPAALAVLGRIEKKINGGIL